MLSPPSARPYSRIAQLAKSVAMIPENYSRLLSNGIRPRHAALRAANAQAVIIVIIKKEKIIFIPAKWARKKFVISVIFRLKSIVLHKNLLFQNGRSSVSEIMEKSSMLPCV